MYIFLRISWMSIDISGPHPRCSEYMYAQEYASFGTHYLTARIRCAEGVEAILRSEGVIPGVSMEQLERTGDEVQGRAKCVPSMDGATLQALIAAVDGVDAVEVEAAVVQPPP